MKFLLCICFTLSSFLLVSQINLTKNQSLKEALSKVEEQVDVKFSYSETSIQVNQFLGKSFKNINLQSFLDYLYQSKNIKHKKSGELMLLFPSEEKRVKAISGYVRENDSKETLIGAVLYDTISKKGVITNEQGFFTFYTSNPDVVFQISYVGQKTIIVNVTLVQDLYRDFYLDANTKLKEVVISSKEEIGMNQVNGQIELSEALFNVLPAIGGVQDPVNTFKYLPGVSSNSNSNRINIRGGSTGENMFVLDGVPLLKMNHWAFNTIMNGDAIKKTTLYKANFPADFTGRTSSIIDMRLKQGNREKLELNGGVGIEYANISFEGPITKKGSFILSARRNWGITNPLSNFNQINYQQVFLTNVDNGGFYDIYGKLNLYLKKGFVSISGMKEKDSRALHDVYDNLGIMDQTVLKGKSSFLTTNFFHELGKSSVINSQITYYNYENSAKNNTVDFSSNIKNNKIHYDLGEPTFVKMTSQEIQSVIFNNKYQYNKEKYSLNGGLNTTASRYINTTSDTLIKSKDSLPVNFEVNAFLNYKRSIGSKLELFVGVANHLYSNKNYTNFQLEPRFNLSYKIKNSKFSTSYTRANQFAHYAGYDIFGGGFGASNFQEKSDLWIPADSTLGFTTSNIIDLSYSVNLGDKYILSSSLYYKKGKNVRDDNFSTRLLSYDSESYGYEILAQKNGDKLTGWVSYDLSWARLDVNENYYSSFFFSQNRIYANFDSRHRIRFGLNWKITKKIDFSAQFMFNTGRPFSFGKLDSLSNIIQDTLDANYQIYGYTEVTEKELLEGAQFRYPSTHELDIQFSYSFGKKWKSKIVVGYKNAYFNVSGSGTSRLVMWRNRLFFDFRPSWYGDELFLGSFPYLTYRFSF